MSEAASSLVAGPSPAPTREEPAQSAAPQGNRMEDLAFQRVPPLRKDLIFRKQQFVGDRYYVIKDPLRLQYFRLLPEEAQMAKWMTEGTTVGELQAKFQKHYPQIECTLKDIGTFIQRLSMSGLLNEEPEKVIQRTAAKERMKSSWLGRWAKTSSTLLFVKVPLVTPGPWLDKLTGMIRFVWTWWFWALALTAMGITAARLTLHGEAFDAAAYNFFSPSNIFLLWVSVILTKTLHEFGHATTCKYFKGHVPEMGVCFICLTPCGYVDASDAWMMPQRRQKIAINIAGLATEFLIATIAANLWLETGPGLLNSLLFNVMLVASVNTIFMNMNPLMKFDGYYVIADLLEIPNLRTKAMAYCGGWLKRLFFGTPPPRASAQNGRIFIAYAIVAFAYMLFITIGLSMIFLRFLNPVGLTNLGVVIGVFIFISLLCMPVAKSFMEVTAMTKATQDARPWRRFMVSAAILIAVLTGLYFWPVHHQVTVQGALVPGDREEIRVGTDGWIDEILVEPNQRVQAGDVLVRLENEVLMARFAEAQADLESAELRRNQASLEGVARDGNYRQDALEQNRIDALRSRYERLKLQMDRLELTAGREGIVRELPDSPLNKIEGAAATQGMRLMAIDAPGALRIVAGLNEEDLARIEADAPVTGQLFAGLDSIEGTVQRLPVRPARERELEQAMFASNGGVLPEATGMSKKQLLERFPLYLVYVDLEASELTLLPGMRVQATIEGKETTFGKRFLEDAGRYLRDRSGGIL